MKKGQKIYIVKYENVCECETMCMCNGDSIDSVYFDKEKADIRAKALFHGYVDDYEIKE